VTAETVQVDGLAAEPPPLVSMQGIRKAFPGVLALDDVDLELRAGEIHALAGENGSGKSTLAKILYGAHQPDAGVVVVDGEPVSFSSPRHAIEHGIVAISQELTLAPTLTVAENILMGRLPRRGGLIDWPKARSAARAALDEVGVEVDTRRRVGELGIELQQEVEVARAVSANSRVLVLDEATSSLSEAATQRLLERLEQLRAGGVAVLFISHRLRELYDCASRATVLRDGRRVGTVPLPQTREKQLVSMMVGREISDLFNKRRIEKGEAVLEVAGLTTEDGSVDEASFDVHAGEILGVAGLVGCGKTELGLALAGAFPASGEIRVHGTAVDLRSPRAAVDAGIGFVPEDRKRSALLPTRTVQQNLSVAWTRRLARVGVINVAEERRLAAETVTRFSVRSPSLGTPIVKLSGGNQQKVILGRWFAIAPGVIVLGEPTRGIDVGAKAEIYNLMENLVAEGAAVLMISSELPEIVSVCDRVYVMRDKTIVGEIERRELSEASILRLAMHS
jgi:ABC-type sugar transport system ATPase subunit